jgi:hypothetical protein
MDAHVNYAFNDEAFCGHVMELLKGHCNRSIAEIGSSDSHTYALNERQP